MPRINPYSPGAGTSPPILVGRDLQFSVIAGVAGLVEAGRRPQHVVLTGLRGVGKTVLLRACLRRLRDRGWLCGYYEVRRDVDAGLAIGTIIAEGSALLPKGARLRRALRSIRSSMGAVTLSGGVDGTVSLQVQQAHGETSDDPYLSALRLFRTLAEAARADGSGVALCIDEIQAFRRKDATTLLQALEADEAEDSRILLLGAGLPVTPTELTKARTYAERFRYEPLDDLTVDEARRALVDPALAEGVGWEQDALDRVVELARGYPFFLQLYASESWDAARGSEMIRLRDVVEAEPLVMRRLDTSVYATRFERVSPTEREYLVAMAELMRRQLRNIGIQLNLDGRVSHSALSVRSGMVAQEMGRNLSELSTVRDRLIRKGVIHSPESGTLAFSVPGFLEYVLRRAGREAS